MAGQIKYLRYGAAALVTLLAFGPLVVAEDQAEQTFDYSDYAAVLKSYVDDKGMVNYRNLKANPERLLSYVRAIARLPRTQYDRWDDNARVAFWLNAYNGLTLKAIIDHYPIRASFFKSRIYPKNSIRQISGVWDKLKFDVSGRKLTLEQIEHKILRVEFNEPRIHMAMVCAAMSCPRLRNEPYVGGRLDEQLDDQSRAFLGHPEKFRVDRGRNTVRLSPIFKWFGADFVGKYASAKDIGRHKKEASSALRFIAGQLEGADKNYVLAGRYRIGYLDYDWSLNEQER